VNRERIFKFQIITLYQARLNLSDGVCISVGKNLKVVGVTSSIPNTVVIDVYRLSEPLRMIGIYWPPSQQRNLNELSKFVINNTIIAEILMLQQLTGKILKMIIVEYYSKNE
jgi:hypothetical protein